MKTSITKHPLYGPQMRTSLLSLPSISLVTRGRISNGKALVKASLEWLAPDGQTGFQEYCGVKYFGGDYTDFAKKNFRLYFRSEFGASKLKFPVFAGHEHGLAAVEEFDQLELRSGSHDMVQRGFYMSNLFADDTMLELGQLNPHGRFVHVYLNGTYWGVFHLRERWGAGMHHRYLGGSLSNYESINGNRNVGGWAWPGVPYDGDGNTWARVKSLRNDFKAVRQWVDVPQYIDYMMVWIFGQCEDEYRCVGPTVPGSGFKFYLNDADGFFQSPANPWYGEPSNRIAMRPPGRQAADGPGSLFSTLFAQGDPDYRTLLADHIYKTCFNAGPLTPASNAARLKIRCDEFQKALPAEAARWGYRNPSNWASVRDDVLAHWLPSRTATVIAELRAAGFYPRLDAPILNQQGGRVKSGFQVLFTGPAAGTIVFTLDGSDPRLSGGVVAPSAQRYTRGGLPALGAATLPVITRNTVLKCRTLDGKQWSALNEAFFQTGPSALEPGEIKITKLNFIPAHDDGAEFLELSNVAAQAVSLRGARFTQGIAYAFADNRDTLLASGQKLTLVSDLFQFRQHYGLDAPVGGIYSGRLKRKFH